MSSPALDTKPFHTPCTQVSFQGHFVDTRLVLLRPVLAAVQTAVGQHGNLE